MKARWRVWAVNAVGRESAESDWREYQFSGGDFTAIDGVPTCPLIHIRADRTLDLAWNANVNGSVDALTISGGRLYIGGSLFDATTGALTAWNPSANDAVVALAVRGRTVYLGGHFTSVGGQVRNRLAALDAASGAVTAWNPNVERRSGVYDLLLDANTIYVGGELARVGISDAPTFIATLPLVRKG